MGIVVYFPAVAPPLANAGVDKSSTPAAAATFANEVRRSMNDQSTATLFACRTEYPCVVAKVAESHNSINPRDASIIFLKCVVQ
jgi:hypothetical protein